MRRLLVPTVLATMAVAAPTVAATTVNASQASLTSLGSFGAGGYHITVSGLIDLIGLPGSGFTMRPDGVPDTPVTNPSYLYFNPAGSVIADGNHGNAGSAFKIGSLVGSFVANPGASNWFAIGYGTTVTLAAPGTIYAMVNDTVHGNNGGAFRVEVTAVPEPADWVLLIAGFGLTGAAMRRRRYVPA